MALDLPQGHWMHAALKKEQARVAKAKTANKQIGAKGPTPAPGSAPAGPAVVASAAPMVTPSAPEAPMAPPVQRPSGLQFGK